MDPIIDRWQFVRSETVALLSSLSDEQLQFKPEGDAWQPLYYQFGCMARTQAVYMKAVAAGRMDFAWFRSEELPSKTDYQATESLHALLKRTNDRWIETLKSNVGGMVTWPDSVKPLEVHVMALAEHERLHHGQLISYFTMAGYALPRGFKQTWAL